MLRLKDREQQAWLDKITRGMFTEALNAFMEDAEQIKFEINDKAILTIKRDEVENVGEYDPDFWNVYPEVKPPEGVPMRVECQGTYRTLRTCLVYKQGAWQYENGVPFEGDTVGLKMRRYRPWV